MSQASVEAVTPVKPYLNLRKSSEYPLATRANARVGVALLSFAALLDKLKRVDEASLANKRIKAARARRIGGGVLLFGITHLGVPIQFVEAMSVSNNNRQQ